MIFRGRRTFTSPPWRVYAYFPKKISSLKKKDHVEYAWRQHVWAVNMPWQLSPNYYRTEEEALTMYTQVQEFMDDSYLNEIYKRR